jgi:hypothetical protein
MVRKVRVLIFAAVIAGVLVGHGIETPAQELPPAPIPVAPVARSEGKLAAQPHMLPAESNTVPVSPSAPAEGSPPILMPPPPPEPLPLPLAPDLWEDRPRYPPPGWIAGIELDLVGPHIKNRLRAEVQITPNLIDTIHVPMAPLDWTGSPRFEVGYRCPNNGGQIWGAYRFLTTEGHATFVDADGDIVGNLKSRLDFNVIDFAYGAGLFAPGPYSDLQWSVGARLAQIYFDSRAADVFQEARTSNHFVGAGPLGALEWWRRLELPGLAVFGRLEGSVPLGSIHQSFEEVFTLSHGQRIGAATSQRMTQAIPTISFDIGLGWTPHWSRYSRLSFGYHFEHWWDLGEVNDSSAELTTQGLFLKGEINY